MIKRFFVITISLLVLLSGMLSLTGCSTWHGFGKDVKDLGESIEDKPNSDTPDSQDADQ